MNYSIEDIRNCLNYYDRYYLNCTYIVETFDGSIYKLASLPGNFAHLLGFKANVIRENGIRNASMFAEMIRNHDSIPTPLIPRTINRNSYSGRKIKNFTKSLDTISKNSFPIMFQPNSSTRLNSTDILFMLPSNFYYLGWKLNTTDYIAESGSYFNPSTWIDESEGTNETKTRFLKNQKVKLIKRIEIINNLTNTSVENKTFRYSKETKIQLLNFLAENDATLLLNNSLIKDYKKIEEEINKSGIVEIEP